MWVFVLSFSLLGIRLPPTLSSLVQVQFMKAPTSASHRELRLQREDSLAQFNSMGCQGSQNLFARDWPYTRTLKSAFLKPEWLFCSNMMCVGWLSVLWIKKSELLRVKLGLGKILSRLHASFTLACFKKTPEVWQNCPMLIMRHLPCKNSMKWETAVQGENWQQGFLSVYWLQTLLIHLH